MPGDNEKEITAELVPEKEVEKEAKEPQIPSEVSQLLKTQSETIAQLQAQLKKSSEVSEEEILKDLDERVEKAPVIKPEDIEQMSNVELAGLIMAEVERAYFTPVVHRIELLRVREELKEVKNKYEGFDEFKDAVHKIATANPSMSIEDAFIHAKAKAGSPIVLKGASKKADDKVIDLADAKEKLEKKAKGEEKKLPAGSTGERSVASSKTVEKSNPTTVKEAVDLAFEKVFKEK